MVENKIFLDTDTISLNENFSTTKLITREKPEIKNYPEDRLTSVLFLPESKGRQGEGGLRTKAYYKKSYDNKPLISIVTVVYNGKKYLEQTINSILDQTYDNVEYIVIDGGSTDGTLEIIQKYDRQIDYWISESDDGIYDAMNKGAGLAIGEYISFLNADDWYLGDSIELIAKNSLKDHPGYLYGDVNLYDDNKVMGQHRANLKRYKKHTPIGHQALFVQTKYLRQMPFSNKYKIIADYDFMIKLIKLNISYIQLDRPLVNFRIAGISSVMGYDKERFQLQYHHFGLLAAMYGYVLETDTPIISHIINKLVKIKHIIEKWNK